ncbi:unnamed protein product [Camellia sinensis]
MLLPIESCIQQPWYHRTLVQGLEAWCCFGQTYMALNDINAAVESFKKALELEPNDAGIKKELVAAKKKVFI